MAAGSQRVAAGMGLIKKHLDTNNFNTFRLQLTIKF